VDARPATNAIGRTSTAIPLPGIKDHADQRQDNPGRDAPAASGEAQTNSPDGRMIRACPNDARHYTITNVQIVSGRQERRARSASPAAVTLVPASPDGTLQVESTRPSPRSTWNGRALTDTQQGRWPAENALAGIPDVLRNALDLTLLTRQGHEEDGADAPAHGLSPRAGTRF